METELIKMLNDIMRKPLNRKMIWRYKPRRFLCNEELVMKNHKCSLMEVKNIFRTYYLGVLKNERDFVDKHLKEIINTCKVNGNVLTDYILNNTLGFVSRKTQLKYIKLVRETDPSIKIVGMKETNFLKHLEKNKTYMLENKTTMEEYIKVLNGFNTDFKYTSRTIYNYINKDPELKKYFICKTIKKEKVVEQEKVKPSLTEIDYEEMFNTILTGGEKEPDEIDLLFETKK